MSSVHDRPVGGFHDGGERSVVVEKDGEALSFGLTGNSFKVLQGGRQRFRSFQISGDGNLGEVPDGHIGAIGQQGFFSAGPGDSDDQAEFPGPAGLDAGNGVFDHHRPLRFHLQLPGRLEEDLGARLPGNAQDFRIHPVHPHVEKIRQDSPNPGSGRSSCSMK